MRRIGHWTVAGLAGIAALGLAGPAGAVPVGCSIPQGLYDFDFADASQYPACFRDVVRGAAINAGLDFGSTGHTSLNISGSGGPAGRTWVTVVDQAPGTPAADNVFGSGIVCADVLIQRYDNTKGGGLVALFNEGPGNKGLALILHDAGNSDRLVLALLDGDPALGGLITPLTSVPLGALIRENNWYRVVMTVLVDGAPQIGGQVYEHADGADPNSAIAAIGPALTYAPAALPAGVQTLGQEGIIGSAISAVENTSFTNFTNVMDNCLNATPPPLGS